MEELDYDDYTKIIFEKAKCCAEQYRHEFLMPEHLLQILLDEPCFYYVSISDVQTSELRMDLVEYLTNKVEQVPADVQYEVELSGHTSQVLLLANHIAQYAGQHDINFTHILKAIIDLPDSMASYLLKKYALVDLSVLLSDFISAYDDYEEDEEEESDDEEEEGLLSNGTSPSMGEKSWRNMVYCVSDHIDDHNPLIGREKELERTIQVLCRKDKNNPLHVGEPGVGKTALVYGLADLLRKGKVPSRLKGYKIYELNLGSLLAGTQFRGDFEKRL